MTTKTIKIHGMSCQHCVMRIKKALDGLNGVKDSKVTIGEAEVKYDEEAVDDGIIKRAIEESGYKVGD